MMKPDDFMDVERSKRISCGILYINIYRVTQYPQKIKISKVPYDKNYIPGKWRKRIGNTVYYYGNDIKENLDEINVDNPLFGQIFRRYLLDIFSESITPPWQLKELRTTLRIVKEIIENYDYSDKIKLQYELTIGVHHWQNTNFGLTVDLKINVIDRESNQRISYAEIKDKYGESIKGSIWRSVQAFHRHLRFDGKKYATAMRDKFNLITNLLKEVFGVSGKEKSFKARDGEVNVIFEPHEIVEVTDYGI